MIRTNKCSLHKYHYPAIISTDFHHIWPLEYHGPKIDNNVVEVGPTEHRNIHRYLDAKLAGKSLPKITRKEKFFAELGYEKVSYYIASMSLPKPL